MKRRLSFGRACWWRGLVCMCLVAFAGCRAGTAVKGGRNLHVVASVVIGVCDSGGDRLVTGRFLFCEEDENGYGVANMSLGRTEVVGREVDLVFGSLSVKIADIRSHDENMSGSVRVCGWDEERGLFWGELGLITWKGIGECSGPLFGVEQWAVEQIGDYEEMLTFYEALKDVGVVVVPLVVEPVPKAEGGFKIGHNQ